MARLVNWGLGLLLPAALIVLWQYEGWRNALPRYLPMPSVIADQWLEMLYSGELFVHAGRSLFRALTGFVIGSMFGLALGLAAAALRPIEDFCEPLISLTYPIPKIAALPIIFAWFGLGDESKVIIIAVSVFYPLYVATFAGAKVTTREHIWAARNMGAGRWRIVMHVLLPSALPQIFNGLRVGLALSFVVMFVAELVSSSQGLGYLITFAQDNERFDLMFVAIVTIGIFGFIADRLLLVVRRSFLAGYLPAAERQ
jgi:ABC-type nitrate/sulfonate/bicarbonate transport system permease component